MSFVVYVCIHRKAVGIIWTCLWWVWCWACALSWASRGSWLRRCCQSAMWTAWNWSLNAQHLVNSPSSWASESSASPASWYSSLWEAQYLWLPYWRSVIFYWSTDDSCKLSLLNACNKNGYYFVFVLSISQCLCYMEFSSIWEHHLSEAYRYWSY